MLCDCSGTELVLISAAIAIEIAKCVTEEELELLSALYHDWRSARFDSRTGMLP
jgi:hypothetical protein